MVCWGYSVSRAQKTWLWSLLFKVFPICDAKSRKDPWLSHHCRGSKLLLVLPSLSGLHGTEKAKIQVTTATFVCFAWGDLYSKRKIFEFRCTIKRIKTSQIKCCFHVRRKMRTTHGQTLQAAKRIYKLNSRLRMTRGSGKLYARTGLYVGERAP